MAAGESEMSSYFYRAEWGTYQNTVISNSVVVVVIVVVVVVVMIARKINLPLCLSN
jgi:preprotein translocase subunit SecE